MSFSPQSALACIVLAAADIYQRSNRIGLGLSYSEAVHEAICELEEIPLHEVTDADIYVPSTLLLMDQSGAIKWANEIVKKEIETLGAEFAAAAAAPRVDEIYELINSILKEISK